MCVFILCMSGGTYSLKSTPNDRFLRSFSWQFCLPAEEVVEEMFSYIHCDVCPGVWTRLRRHSYKDHFLHFTFGLRKFDLSGLWKSCTLCTVVRVRAMHTMIMTMGGKSYIRLIKWYCGSKFQAASVLTVPFAELLNTIILVNASFRNGGMNEDCFVF